MRQKSWGLPLLSLAVLVSALVIQTRRVEGAEAALRELAERRGFYVGAAVAMPFLDDKAYQDTLKRQFNTCVAENIFKMESLQPYRGSFAFAQPDKLAEFAQANHMRLRGHTLVWHSQNPWWLTHGHWTREEGLKIMEEHITTVMRHFKGKVYAWDVVNEAVSDQAPWGLRADNIWFQAVGPDFVQKAFEFARRADPEAVLYYNDYGADGPGPKADGVYRLVKDLKAKNLVDGVGWQSHLGLGWRADKGNVTNAQRLAALGLDISSTELDFPITMPSTAEKLAAQAESYRSMLQFCLSQPNIKAMVMWGFTDRSSWIPIFFKGQGDALIFDRDYKPKPAYYALEDVLMHSAPVRSSIKEPDRERP